MTESKRSVVLLLGAEFLAPKLFTQTLTAPAMTLTATPESNRSFHHLGKDLEPFYVLHTSASKLPKRISSGAGVRKKVDFSPPPPAAAMEAEQLRREAFEHVWSELEASIEAVLRRMNAQVFDEIASWVLQSFDHIRSRRKNGPSDVMVPYPLALDCYTRQIYTALVLTRNVEFVDDLLTFHELGSFLRSHGIHVANLSSMDFKLKAGIGGCLRHLLKQLVGFSPDFPDLDVLASWYAETEHFDKPVVVIIEDMERCGGKTLAEFISIVGEWAVKLPITLICGVATTVNALVRILPSTVLQHLQTFKFTLASPVEKMDAIVCEVLVKSSVGFHTGYEVTSYFKDFIIKHDGSITSVIRALKIACVKHFTVEALSYLGRGMILNDSLGLLKKQCELLEDEMLNDAFNRPSCREIPFDKSTMRIGEELVTRLSDLRRSQESWSSVIKCVCEAGKFLKIRALDIFSEALDPDFIAKFSDYCVALDDRSKDASMTNCNMFGGEWDELSNRLSIAEAVHLLRHLHFVSLSPLLRSWQGFTKGMEEINKKVKELQCQLITKAGDKNFKEWPTVHRSLSQTHLTVENSSGVNYKAALLLESMIRKHMIPMECIPSHELICFKDSEFVGNALLGDSRRIVQANLLMSPAYIHCSCCRNTSASLQPNLHDTAVMHEKQAEGEAVTKVEEKKN